MRELLERWARLEPERCGISEHAAHLGKPFAFRIHWATLDADHVNRAVLLAAVIDAIEARGWLWQMGRLPNGNHWARVWDRGPDGEHVDRMNCAEGDPYRKEDDTPAAALLGAYLAALEAEAAQSPDGYATARLKPGAEH